MKEPSQAFLTYAAEFLGDIEVQIMLPDELGVYWRLLLNAWIEDGLPDDVVRLEALTWAASISRLYGSPHDKSNGRSTVVHRSFAEMWEVVKNRFYVDDSGRLRNYRQEEIREVEHARQAQRKRAGLASAEARRTHVKRPRNERSTVVHSEGKGREGKRSKDKEQTPQVPKAEPPEAAFVIVDSLIQLVKAKKDIKINGNKRRRWADSVERLQKVDGIGYGRQEAALRVYRDHYGEAYWPVVESGAAWREKFTNVEAAIDRMDMDLDGEREPTAKEQAESEENRKWLDDAAAGKNDGKF